MSRLGALGMLAGILLTAGCSPSDGSDPSVAKYNQTWPKQYSDTTCREFRSEMSTQQRFAASADMLTGARSRDGGSGVPPDALVYTFMRAIDKPCKLVPTDDIVDVAVAEYLTDRAIFRP
jgi:hypothetical protein